MSQYYDLDSFVMDHRRVLQLVQRATHYEPDAAGVTFHCETERFKRDWRDRYGTLVEVGTPQGAGKPVTVRIDFPDEAVFRLRMAVGEHATVPDNHTPMLRDDFAYTPVTLNITRQENAVTLQSAELHITVELDPWRLLVRDMAGNTLYETIPAAMFQHPPTGMSSIGGASISDAWPWFFRHVYPLGFVEDADSGETQVFETSELFYDEHIYGLGEKFSDIDKRGQAINLWHANATGNAQRTSYKNIPFYMSSRGFGVFINSAYPMQFHLGDLTHIRRSVHLQDDLLDMFFIYGPRYKDILPRYTAITGTPNLPPLWSFGLWMSRMSYKTQDEVETVARQLREHDIPCDVIHIDTDWFAEPWVNDLTFSDERFPDPAAMIATLREQGYHLTLWQLPYIATNSKFYPEGVEKGYFALGDDGQPRHIAGFFGQAAVIDYSNPAAVAWMQRQFEPLFAIGVAAIKTDFGEGAPVDAHYANVGSLEMHNLYPLLYNRAIYEKTVEQTGEGIVWGRSAYAGSQRYPVLWGGDPAVLWGDLGTLWHGGLSLGLCGFPFWSVDIGGFGGTPTPELYIRWAQAGLFVSHPRAHGPIAREPWAFGEAAVQIFRKYAHLRYQLMPYVWSTAHKSVQTSLPVMRPLLLDWQDDPTTAHIDDQYLFGEWLMVAPIVDPSNLRRVYFPEGDWVDYWTDTVISGPAWRTIQADLETLPLYVRAGAILLMAPPMAHTQQKPWNPLTVHVYPANESQFDLIDGEDVLPFTCVQTAERTDITTPAGARVFVLVIHTLTEFTQITLDGEQIMQVSDSGAFDTVETGWMMNVEGQIVVKVNSDPAPQVVTIA